MPSFKIIGLLVLEKKIFKFQDHRTSSSGEEDFLKVFTIYGHGGHLG